MRQRHDNPWRPDDGPEPTRPWARALGMVAVLALVTPGAYGQAAPAAAPASLKPEIHIGMGHSGGVRAVEFSPNGRLLASVGGDGAVKLWDVAGGRELRTIRSPSGRCSASVAFTPDSRQVVLVDAARYVGGKGVSAIIFCDVASGRVVRTIPGHAGQHIGISQDGRTMMTANSLGAVRFWDLATGKVARTIQAHPKDLSRARFGAGGRLLVTCNRAIRDGVAIVWDVATGKVVREFIHTYCVLDAAVGSDGRLLITMMSSGVTVWDVATGRKIRFIAHKGGYAGGIAFSSDDKVMACIGQGGLGADRKDTVVMWSVATGQRIRALDCSESLSCIAFSPDGRFIAGGGRGAVWLWQPPSGSGELELSGHGGPEAVTFSRDGRLVATASKDKTAKLWDVATGRELHTLTGHTRWVYGVAFSPDGRQVATASWDKTVKLWDIATGRVVRTLEGFKGNVYCVAFSPDGRVLATGSTFSEMREVPPPPGSRRRGTPRRRFSGGVVKLWSTATGKEIRSFEGHSPAVTGVAFSSDGRRLVTSNGRAYVSAGKAPLAIVWDVATGTKVRALDDGTGKAKSAVFSPDGRTVATASRTGVGLWHLASGRRLRTMPGHDSVAFTPDGRVLICGHQRGIRLFDVASGRLLRELTGCTGTAFALNPQGKLLAVGGAEGLRLRPLLSGLAAGVRLQGDPADLARVQFTSSGELVVLARKAVMFWDTMTGRQTRMLEKEDKWGWGPGMTLSRNRQTVAQGSRGKIRFRSLVTGRVTREQAIVMPGSPPPGGSGRSPSLARTAPMIVSVAYGPNDRVLAIVCQRTLGSPSMENRGMPETESVIYSCDAATGRVKREFGAISSRVSAMTVSPDGQFLAAGSANRYDPNKTELKVWNMSTGRIAHRVKVISGVDCLAFSPDSTVLAVGGQGSGLSLFETSSWQKKPLRRGIYGAMSDLAFSPDGRLLAMGSTQTSRVAARQPNAVHIWDMAAGRILHTFVGHTQGVHSVSWHPDGRFLASGSADNTVKLWDVRAGKLAATLVSNVSGQWVTVLPDNYYRCSRSTLKRVSLRLGDRIFPFEQADLVYNRPDIVMKRLGCKDTAHIGAAAAAYRKRLSRMGLKEQDLSFDRHVPRVEIATNVMSVTSEAKTIQLKVKASDEKYLLDRLMVWVNDVPVLYDARSAEPGLSLRSNKSRTLERTIPLELSVGANRIQVSVLNARGAESLRETLHVRCVAAAPKPALWVVAIGVSTYCESKYNLRFAAKDATDIVTSLTSQKRLGKYLDRQFAKVRVLTLTDRDATREKILAAGEFLAQSGVDDTALVFAAGHGVVDKGYTYYFCTYDMDFAAPSERGLSFGELNGLLGPIPSRKKLLLLDTCHAGEIDADTPAAPTVAKIAAVKDAAGTVKVRAFATRGIGGQAASKVRKQAAYTMQLMQEDLFADVRRGTGAVVIGACSGDEYSVEGTRWNNGVFTYSILEGLEELKADADKDNRLRVSEIRDYVIARVRQLTAGGQNPTVRRENLANDFSLVEILLPK